MPGCKLEGCKNEAIFESDFCWEHIKDKKSYRDNIIRLADGKTSFEGVNLSRVDLGSMNFAHLNLSGANLSRASMVDCNFFDSNLKNAELLGADLSNSDLTSADLAGSDLTRCCLCGTRLWHANMENANLIEANLSRADLWNARLFNARFWRTDLSSAISISKNNFRHNVNNYLSTCRIGEKGIQSAEESYRNLKKYFLANGRYDDASWASFKEKTMEKALLKKKKNLAYIPSLIMDLLCGYGEKPQRIILSSFFVILFYAFLYLILNAITYSVLETYKMSLGDYIYYSVITFTTVGYGDFIPKASLVSRILAASEGFVGTFMIGLFIFTLARKYSAR